MRGKYKLRGEGDQIMDTVDKYLGEGKKLYYEMDNVGKAKYTVNYQQ